ncbi:hypothetical protein LCGC14_1475920 [marine sediment metagenome]|uniref:Uncharacterized protein n=1 Tax=marine sediment metagenome TaxID=412755 RepID=A0A0F9JWY0_9ZZZZ
MEGGNTVMVNYPDLSSLNNESGIAGLMALPNSSYPYFWAWILGGIWVILVMGMYFKDKETTGRTRIFSSMAVSCLAILLLSTIGTIFGIVSPEIMIYILVFCITIIGTWFLTSGR